MTRSRVEFGEVDRCGHCSAFQPSYLGAMANFFTAGAAVARRRRGYLRLGDLILDEQFTAQRVTRLFETSASKSAKADAALIIFAGSIARYRAQPTDWSPEPEASLVRGLVGDDFDAIRNSAAKLVHLHWHLIEALAQGAEAA